MLYVYIYICIIHNPYVYIYIYVYLHPQQTILKESSTFHSQLRRGRQVGAAAPRDATWPRHWALCFAFLPWRNGELLAGHL